MPYLYRRQPNALFLSSWSLSTEPLSFWLLYIEPLPFLLQDALCYSLWLLEHYSYRSDSWMQHSTATISDGCPFWLPAGGRTCRGSSVQDGASACGEAGACENREAGTLPRGETRACLRREAHSGTCAQALPRQSARH